MGSFLELEKEVVWSVVTVWGAKVRTLDFLILTLLIVRKFEFCAWFAATSLLAGGLGEGPVIGVIFLLETSNCSGAVTLGAAIFSSLSSETSK